MTSLCPCQSGLPFEHCCEPYLNAVKPAPTAEALMRSRYTAFTRQDVDYLEKTSRGKAAADFEKEKVKDFAQKNKFEALEIIRAHQPFPDRAYVEFVVHFNDAHHHHQHLHELSEFQLEDGCWYYVDGRQDLQAHQHHHVQAVAEPLRRTEPKIGRNDPCYCGSGKKFKKCCGVV